MLDVWFEHILLIYSTLKQQFEQHYLYNLRCNKCSKMCLSDHLVAEVLCFATTQDAQTVFRQIITLKKSIV